MELYSHMDRQAQARLILWLETISLLRISRGESYLDLWSTSFQKFKR